MSVRRFFSETPLSEGSTGDLTAEQARQIRKVLRLEPGDRLTLFDGSGAEAAARIADLLKDAGTYRVESIDYPDREPSMQLTVGLALIRSSRFESAVQQLTEIGVARIVPLVADRCVVRVNTGDEWSKRAGRLHRIAIEAAEQSERVTLPLIAAPMTVERFLREFRVIALVERESAPALIGTELDQYTALAIGPEGGWSPRELEEIAAQAAGTATLGRLILRAETAAIAAAATALQRQWDRPESGDSNGC